MALNPEPSVTTSSSLSAEEKSSRAIWPLNLMPPPTPPWQSWRLQGGRGNPGPYGVPGGGQWVLRV